MNGECLDSDGWPAVFRVWNCPWLAVGLQKPLAISSKLNAEC